MNHKPHWNIAAYTWARDPEVKIEPKSLETFGSIVLVPVPENQAIYNQYQ